MQCPRSCLVFSGSPETHNRDRQRRCRESPCCAVPLVAAVLSCGVCPRKASEQMDEPKTRSQDPESPKESETSNPILIGAMLDGLPSGVITTQVQLAGGIAAQDLPPSDPDRAIEWMN